MHLRFDFQGVCARVFFVNIQYVQEINLCIYPLKMKPEVNRYVGKISKIWIYPKMNTFIQKSTKASIKSKVEKHWLKRQCIVSID